MDMKPLNKINIEWSPKFAYAIGLLVTDGNLSPDKRHIIFTSKDKELAINFQKGLKATGKIGKKSSGFNKEKKYYVVQFSDINFYKFLLKIGLMPKKSKVIADLKIPKRYFFDFLRGHFDGDGTFYSYWDKRWKSSFMFYTVFMTASEKHIKWLQDCIFKYLKIKGYITKNKKLTQKNYIFSLRYAKKDSLKLISKLYYNTNVICLSRKREKINKVIAINKL